MTVVRLVGFTTLSCGCLVGRYRELAADRQVAYVEEKAPSCDRDTHRRNQPIAADQADAPVSVLASASAS